MTALEVFEKRIKIGTLSRDYGHTVDDVLHIDNANEIDTIEIALNELETLKRDVARFFELDGYYIDMITEEYSKLRDRLSKVGKQE